MERGERRKQSDWVPEGLLTVSGLKPTYQELIKALRTTVTVGGVRARTVRPGLMPIRDDWPASSPLLGAYPASPLPLRARFYCLMT